MAPGEMDIRAGSPSPTRTATSTTAAANASAAGGRCVARARPLRDPPCSHKTIATLEKKMKDQKIELPPRQSIAEAPGSTDKAPCSGAPTSEACTDGAP